LVFHFVDKFVIIERYREIKKVDDFEITENSLGIMDSGPVSGSLVFCIENGDS
jgi:hypothetical protein